MGFCLAVLTGIGGNISERLMIWINPTMEIIIREAKTNDYSENPISPVTVWINVKLSVRNKKYPNTWEKLQVEINDKPVNGYYFAGSNSTPIYLAPYEMKQAAIELSLQGDAAPKKGQNVQVRLIAKDSYNKNCITTYSFIAGE